MHAHECLQYEYEQEACSDFGVSPIAGIFRRHHLEQAFQRHCLRETQSRLRITLSFCACFYVVFALTDVAVLGYTGRALALFLARLFVALTAASGLYLVARHPKSIAMPRIAATMAEIVGMGAFLVIVHFRPGEIPWHTTSLSIMLIVVYLFIPNSFMHATAVAISSTLAFGLLSLWIGALSVSETVLMAMLLTLANAFGIIAARRYQRMWRNEFRAQAILRDLSFRDHLTGCFNRRYLEEHLLDQEIERASRYPTWLTVILCDLDHFKSVNDTYGHQTGDAVLRHFAALTQATCREHIDSIIRYGGEEFMLILPETDLKGGIRMAERLRKAIADHPACCENGRAIRLTASFGVASVDFSSETEGVSAQSLTTTADELLYRAKHAGRNCVEFAELSGSPVVP